MATRRPDGPSSAAMQRVRISTSSSLERAVGAWREAQTGRNALIEPVFRITPPGRIALHRLARTERNAPARLTSSTRSKSAARCSEAGAKTSAIAALLTRMSSPPKRRRTVANIACTSFSAGNVDLVREMLRRRAPRPARRRPALSRSAATTMSPLAANLPCGRPRRCPGRAGHQHNAGARRRRSRPCQASEFRLPPSPADARRPAG